MFGRAQLVAFLSCRRKYFALASLVLVAATHPVQATVIYVDISAPAGGNGLSWQSAFRSPHQALKMAQAGDEIRIAKGVYRPAGANGNRARSFKLKDGVIIQGGYAGLTQPNPDLLDPSTFITRLSGDLNKNDGNSPPGSSAYGDNSFHVLVGTNLTRATVLRGLVISGGSADAPNDNYPYPNRIGGGLRCVGGSGPTIEHCTFERNYADLQGGGLYSDGNPLVKFCTFADNIAYSSGGGMMVNKAVIRHCFFIKNLASPYNPGGGGIRGQKVIVTNCTFRFNKSSSINCDDKSSIRNCLFENNSADDGGGVFAHGQVNVVDCDFYSNGASTFGGGIFAGLQSLVTIVNCRFAGNSAQVGSAIHNRGSMLAVNCIATGNAPTGALGTICNSGGTLTLVNCTVSNNTNDSLSGAVTNNGGPVYLHNCIIWGNQGGNVLFDEPNQVLNWITNGSPPGTIEIMNCCIEGWSGALGGSGNFSADPQFVNVAGPDGIIGTLDDDVRLSASSPCIDEGSIELLPADEFDLDGDDDVQEAIPVDLEGQPRIVGPSVDLGALEAP